MASWDVFFSYSRKDSEIVQRCVDACAREGIRVWLDVNPRPPELTRLPIFITHGILESHLLCLFGSRNALSSRWVKEEFGTFAKRAWGFWDDRLEPIAVVARLPDFDLESSVFVEPEWCASANEHFAAVDVSIAKDDPKPLVEKLQHILGLVRKSLDGKDEAHDRLATAELFCREALPTHLLGWDYASLGSILERFDELTPPYDAWFRDPSHRDEQLDEALGEVRATGVTGTHLAVLFAEAVGSVLGNRYSSVSERADEEIREIFATIQVETRVTSKGSPVDLLCSASIEEPIACELQHAYFRCRSADLDRDSRDALDLTTLLSLSADRSRYGFYDPALEAVVDDLVNQRDALP